MVEIVIRDYRPSSDDPYIYSTWSKFSFYSPKIPILVSKSEFFRKIHKEIKEILELGTVKIACIKDDPNVIMGYIAVHNGEEKWLCIKKDFRTEGVKALLRRSVKGLLDEESSSDNSAST